MMGQGADWVSQAGPELEIGQNQGGFGHCPGAGRPGSCCGQLPGFCGGRRATVMHEQTLSTFRLWGGMMKDVLMGWKAGTGPRKRRAERCPSDSATTWPWGTLHFGGCRPAWRVGPEIQGRALLLAHCQLPGAVLLRQYLISRLHPHGLFLCERLPTPGQGASEVTPSWWCQPSCAPTGGVQAQNVVAVA